MAEQKAYIVSARRTALGRVGGLHNKRRIEELAAPVIGAALRDAKLSPGDVEEVVIGNATAGDNAARLIALAGQLPEAAPALTIDRDGASGLDAVLAAGRLVRAGERDIVIAGGAESFSTAPWRVIKPRFVHQTPRFAALEDSADPGQGMAAAIESAETAAQELQLARGALDAFAMRSHVLAYLAHEAKRYVGEIVPLKATPEEARDESLDGDVTLEDLAGYVPIRDESGRLTRGSISAPHDGAAMTIVVSERIWQRLGKPPALRITGGLSLGVAPQQAALAPLEAARALLGRLNGACAGKPGLVETSEGTAPEALAVKNGLGLDDGALNPDGGAIARGAPGAAGGAVLVARLFSRLVRQRKPDTARYGLVAHGARGGLGVAALFEAV